MLVKSISLVDRDKIPFCGFVADEAVNFDPIEHYGRWVKVGDKYLDVPYPKTYFINVKTVDGKSLTLCSE